MTRSKLWRLRSLRCGPWCSVASAPFPASDFSLCQKWWRGTRRITSASPGCGADPGWECCQALQHRGVQEGPQKIQPGAGMWGLGHPVKPSVCNTHQCHQWGSSHAEHLVWLLIQLLLLLLFFGRKCTALVASRQRQQRTTSIFQRYKRHTREVSGNFRANLKLFLVALYFPEAEMAETAVMGLWFWLLEI